MRTEEIRELGETELKQRLEELEEEFFRAKLRGAYEELENPMKIRQLRRDIARLKTIQRERQLVGSRGPRGK